MHWNTFKQDNYSIVGGDGGCRGGEVRVGLGLGGEIWFDVATLKMTKIDSRFDFLL